MNNIIIIMKKELKRFFTDKRLLLSLVLPGVIIFIVYSIMGSLTDSFINGNGNYIPKICVINENAEFDLKLKAIGYEYEKADYATSEEAIAALKEKKIDLVVEYEENFDEKRAAHEVNEDLPAPKVTVTSYSTETNSAMAAATVSASLSSSSVEKISYLVASQDVATSADTSVAVISMIVPMLVLSLLFTGCMAVATESIAGEKERGTIATLLATPVKRSHIAMGKILALSITALLSSAISFTGVMASIPRLLSGMGDNVINFEMYGFSTYIFTFGVIVITVLVFTVLLSIISALSKTVKEASQYALPVMLLVVVGGIFTMFGGKDESLWQYFIPILNSAKCLSELFSIKFAASHFLITLGVNGVLVGIGIWVLAKLFGSERIMFDK